MNAAQRKTLEDIRGNLSSEYSRIESECEAEQEKLDNMPESLQDSDKGQKMQEGIDALTESMELVMSAMDSLDNLT